MMYTEVKKYEGMKIILFCESLREHVMKIINFEKKMIPLTNALQESCE